jgi:SAM-dependent methyltransferase
MMSEEEKAASNLDIYRSLLTEHGYTAQGVGWKDEEVQSRRFFALMDNNQYGVSSILDVGCGYGALVKFLNDTRKGWFYHIHYTGIDVVPEYIEMAVTMFGSVGKVVRRFHELDVRDSYEVKNLLYPSYDLVIASGVLAYYQMPDRLEILDAMWELTGRTLAFNMTTRDTYIGDLNMILPRFKTKNWVMRHDYGLDDVTVVVKKG